MNQFFNAAYLEKMLFDMQQPRPLKRIKVTPDFYNYLVAICKPPVILHRDCSPKGYYGTFTGVPIEVDDEILSGYYELVY